MSVVCRKTVVSQVKRGNLMIKAVYCELFCKLMAREQQQQDAWCKNNHSISLTNFLG